MRFHTSEHFIWYTHCISWSPLKRLVYQIMLPFVHPNNHHAYSCKNVVLLYLLCLLLHFVFSCNWYKSDTGFCIYNNSISASTGYNMYICITIWHFTDMLISMPEYYHTVVTHLTSTFQITQLKFSFRFIFFSWPVLRL